MHANGTSDPDTICFQLPASATAPARITLTIEPQDGLAGAASGDMDITTDLTIEGPGPDRLEIAWPENARADRIFDISSGDMLFARRNLPRQGQDPPTVVIRGLKILRGLAFGDGGGIRNFANLTLSDVIVEGNQARAFAFGVQAPSFVNGRGGGIFSSGSLSLSRVSVTGNSAVAVLTGPAGAQAACVLSDLLMGQGGGIYAAGALEIDRSTIAGNTSNGFGGGLYWATSGNGPVQTGTLLNTTVSGNRALYRGGGILIAGAATLEARNCTIADNDAVTINGVTLETALQGTGGGGVANAGSFDLQNSLVVLNEFIADAGDQPQEEPCGEDPDDLLLDPQPDSCGSGFLPINSQGNNLGGDETCGTLDQAAANFTLLPLTDYGGPTDTHALPPGSEAVDRFDCGAGNAPQNDQRGAARPMDGDLDQEGALCDVGAYEAAPEQRRDRTVAVPSFDRQLDSSLSYIMLGTPLSLQTTSPLDWLQPLFGEPSPQRWRLWRYDPVTGQDLEFTPGDPAFDLLPGRAYWLVTALGGDLVLQGETANALGLAGLDPQIELQPGPQQISSPFNFPLDWSGCMTGELPPGVSQSLFGFESQMRGNFMAEVLLPGQGYWVFNQSGVVQTLTVSPLCALGGALSQSGGVQVPSARNRPPGPRNPTPGQGWRVQLSVESGGLRDSDNFLGLDTAAANGLDALDYPEAPPAHGVSLHFLRPAWNTEWPSYASDIRSWRKRPIRPRQDAEGQEDLRRWEFQIFAPPGAWVELRWKAEGISLSALKLIEPDSHAVLRGAEQGVYRFNIGRGGQRRLMLAADPKRGLAP